MENNENDLFHYDSKDRKIPLSTLGTRHLLNIIQKIAKGSVEGMLVKKNFVDPKYDGKILYGDDLRTALNINKYKKALIKKIVEM